MGITQLQIRELRPDDAETLIVYTKQIGGESDNLTFDADGFPVIVEKERDILASMHDDPHSIMLGVWHDDDLIADGSINVAAIHLYEKFGFKQTGTLPAYFKIGNEHIDFISMCLDLR